MATSEFRLPDPGEGLVEAEIVTWRVAVGDVVKVNDILVEIETAKSLVELPIPWAGTVSALHVSVDGSVSPKALTVSATGKANVVVDSVSYGATMLVRSSPSGVIVAADPDGDLTGRSCCAWSPSTSRGRAPPSRPARSTQTRCRPRRRDAAWASTGSSGWSRPRTR